MNDAVKIMMLRYNCHSLSDYENALKEIVQEIALLGLWRSKFFEHAAFYGGTALRILYGLDRFSEDLDFSLLKKNVDFNFDNYSSAIENELNSFGFNVSVDSKIKKNISNIDSIFIKAGTLQNFILIELPKNVVKKIHSSKILKIKLEIDKDPPKGFETEAKYLFNPIPFSVNTYALPFLFAGKMHAVLCRSWKNRVKGRDWFDLIWFVGRNVPLNLKHLELRLKQSKHLEKNIKLTKKLFWKMIEKKIYDTDFILAKNDVINLLKDKAPLELWSKNFFQEVANKINTI